MTHEEIFEQAIKLTNSYDVEMDNVHWVTMDRCSTDGDYCSNCIKQAVKDARKEYLLEQHKLPIEQRDNPFSEFDYEKTCGGYESNRFRYCDSCGNNLDCDILPSVENIQYVIEDLKDEETNEMSDELKWRINELIYNRWEKNDEYHSDCYEPTLKLAEMTIEFFKEKAKLAH